MSAPPPANRSEPRFVSSINIPIQRESGGGDMGSYQSQPNQSQTSSKPTERVIPIHVEGRDEPVIPKNVHQAFSQTPPSQPHSTFHQPEPEIIFGNRANLSDFMNRNPSRFPGREDIFRRHDIPHVSKFQQQSPKVPQEPPMRQQNVHPQHQVPPQQQQHPQYQQAPPQAHQQVPSQMNQQAPQPPQQEVPHPQQKQQTPPPQQAPKTPIDQIQSIQKDVSELMMQVEQFSGKPKDKQYLYLDEMLTRNLIKLDNIDTQGQENIRSARKEAIRCIEKCISVLESKAIQNVENIENKMQVENQKQEPVMEMEVSSTTDAKVDDNKIPEQPMEIVPDSNQVPKEENQGAADSSCNPVESKPEDVSKTPNVSEEAKLEAKPENQGAAEAKMDVEAEKSAEGAVTVESCSAPSQQNVDENQVGDTTKEENKKEKKKGKKKEKPEKK